MKKFEGKVYLQYEFIDLFKKKEYPLVPYVEKNIKKK